MKPGPGLLDQRAQAHGPGTKGQCAIGPLSMHPRPAYSVTATQLGLDGFAWVVVRGPTAGVTLPNLCS